MEDRARALRRRAAWKQGSGMDELRAFLEEVKRQRYAQGNFLGLLNVLIGRTIARGPGQPISPGMNWRTLADLLRLVRWDPEAVRELGLDPAELPPRDRQRYWFMAISRAGVDSAAARQAGERLTKVLESAGYRIGPTPKSS